MHDFWPKSVMGEEVIRLRFGHFVVYVRVKKCTDIQSGNLGDCRNSFYMLVSSRPRVPNYEIGRDRGEE